MPHVDLALRVMGSILPVDHGYALYSAINRVVPALHDARDVGVHPIRGRYIGDASLHLTSSSRLVVRLPDERIRYVLALAGKTLDVDGHQLRVGIPETRVIRPAAMLHARLVTIKGVMGPGGCPEAVRRRCRVGTAQDYQCRSCRATPSLCRLTAKVRPA